MNFPEAHSENGMYDSTNSCSFYELIKASKKKHITHMGKLKIKLSLEGRFMKKKRSSTNIESLPPINQLTSNLSIFGIFFVLIKFIIYEYIPSIFK